MFYVVIRSCIVKSKATKSFGFLLCMGISFTERKQKNWWNELRKLDLKLWFWLSMRMCLVCVMQMRKMHLVCLRTWSIENIVIFGVHHLWRRTLFVTTSIFVQVRKFRRYEIEILGKQQWIWSESIHRFDVRRRNSVEGC